MTAVYFMGKCNTNFFIIFVVAINNTEAFSLNFYVTKVSMCVCVFKNVRVYPV